MTTCTPGPWKVYHAKLRPQFATKIIEVQDITGNAVVHWSGFDAAPHSLQRKLANARVMAAAPTMLAALREVEAVMTIVEPRSDKNEYLACLQHVRCAIAQANGRSGDVDTRE